MKKVTLAVPCMLPSLAFADADDDGVRDSYKHAI